MCVLVEGRVRSRRRPFLQNDESGTSCCKSARSLAGCVSSSVRAFSALREIAASRWRETHTDFFQGKVDIVTDNVLPARVCSVCGTEATPIRVMRPIAYGGLTIDVEDEYMRCESCGEEFYGPGQAEAVDSRASIAARRTDRILPFEIRAIRKKLGLTQRELESEFGLGEKVVTRWERGLFEPPTPTVLLLRALERGALSVESLRPRHDPEPARYDYI